MKSTMYISTMSITTQNSIQADLQSIGLGIDDVSTAMNSRLCDLEDTINIEKYL